MAYDDWKIAQEHSALGFGKQKDPVTSYSGPIEHISDEEAVRRDHGVGMGVYLDPVASYNGPIEHRTLEQSVRIEHGLAIGVPNLDFHGTRNPDEKEIVINMMKANGVSAEGYQLLQGLPDVAIIKIIQTRFCNSANKLQDRFGLNQEAIKDLGKHLNLDFNIILTLLAQGRNLFEPNINATNYMGDENLQNIIGLLDVYKSEIEQAGISLPLIDGFTGEVQINPETGKAYDAFEMIEKVKEVAKAKADEMGIDIGGKSI